MTGKRKATTREVRGADGRLLNPTDGHEYYVALGKLGGRPRRMRFHAPRRKAGTTTAAAKESGLWAALESECFASGFNTKGLADRPAAGFAGTRHQEEEEEPITATNYRFS